MYEVLTPTGFKPFKGIRKKTINSEIFTITFENGLRLHCTPEHRILLADNSYQTANNLGVGQNVITSTGIQTIQNITMDFQTGTGVYDLLDVETHCYYTNGVISHNCEFMGASNTLIASKTLNTLVWNTPLMEQETYQGVFRKYVDPIENHVYVCVVDVSEGVGMDYSVVNIIDITDNKYIQVALYKSNKIPAILLSECISFMAQTYNMAIVLIENNGIGVLVLNELKYNLEYENLILTTKNDISDYGETLGVRTDKKVKAAGCTQLKLLMESNILEIHDQDTIQELFSFSRYKTSYAAEVGAHDDIVMTLVLFAWLSQTEYFKELNNINYKQAIMQDSTEYELPLGFFHDGL